LAKSSGENERSTGGEPVAEADAAFTDQFDQVLCVVTADCLPVAMTNASGTKLCVAHAGWRGLANGVLEASLSRFSNDEALHVWFGPAIGPACFEVGIEVMDAFVAIDAAHSSSFTAHPTDSKKRFANIYELARQSIREYAAESDGVVHFSGGTWCTAIDGRWSRSPVH